MRLLVVDDQPDAIYLDAGGRVERWPYDADPTQCM